jgi:trans-aconitate methyltransferase
MNQLKIAHNLWKEHIESTQKRPIIVVDATCGNGHDSLFLSNFPYIELHCIDIQCQAIEETKRRLGDKKAYFHHISHESFECIAKPIDLIVYNLGYLPGSDKQTITTAKTTLLSLTSALSLLTPGGMISVMVYTGHPGGEQEKVEILNFLSSISDKISLIHLTSPLKQHAPELLILKKNSWVQ